MKAPKYGQQKTCKIYTSFVVFNYLQKCAYFFFFFTIDMDMDLTGESLFLKLSSINDDGDLLKGLSLRLLLSPSIWQILYYTMKCYKLFDKEEHTQSLFLPVLKTCLQQSQVTKCRHQIQIQMQVPQFLALFFLYDIN